MSASDRPSHADEARQPVDSHVIGGAILAVVGVLFWLALRGVMPATANQPATLPYLAAVLAGIGLLLFASPPVAIVTFLALGLTWHDLRVPLWRVLGGVLETRVGNAYFGADLLQTYTPLLILAAAFALAIWHRPPRRHVDGSPILATRLVSWFAWPAMVLGPPLGLVAWLWLAPNDVYGRPLMVGLLVGGLGLLLFIAYSGLYRLLGRPGLAAGLAAVWSVATLAIFSLR
ncbi:MAG TPA: hypothetical protein VK194_04520 [Candidatus Deferrimicrobium sp.]|nr:hypothetical protein [Candidatus Deferrimicrobium sp.]